MVTESGRVAAPPVVPAPAAGRAAAPAARCRKFRRRKFHLPSIHDPESICGPVSPQGWYDLQAVASGQQGACDVTEQPLVLVINCGSSSLKFAVHALDRPVRY